MSSNLKVFVHVPKTAGTSFRTAMEDSFGLEAMAFDYGPDSPKTSPLVRDLVYREDNPERLWSELQAGGVRILSGHVRAERYVRYCDPENIMVFLRDPIQRLVRWTPSLGQVGGQFKVDSSCFVMPPFSHCTLPSGSCHQARKSAGVPSCTS